jgi:Tfp pilus assembly protein PilN
MFFTNTLLKETSLNKKAKRNNAELSKTLAQRRIEAKEIQEIRANLEKHQKSIEAMQLVLDKKNPWSYLLELINRKLGSNRISWLNNMSVDKGKLHLAGVTTNRSNVVDFADMLPNCQIAK